MFNNCTSSTIHVVARAVGVVVLDEVRPELVEGLPRDTELFAFSVSSYTVYGLRNAPYPLTVTIESNAVMIATYLIPLVER